MSQSGQDDEMSDVILSKADALIRRNRPDGVGSDAEELPMLTEIIDDLPGLSEFLAPPPQGVPVPLTPPLAPRAAAAPVSGDARHPVVIGLSQEQVDILINDAVERAQREMLKSQDRVIQETIDRVRAENVVSHAQAIQAALIQGHREGRDEGLQQGVAKGRAEGREEMRVQHELAMNSAQRDIHQTVVLQFSERLIELDSSIQQNLDAWLAKELPQIVANELGGLAERIRAQTANHMRATLLPQISDRLASLLDPKQ